VDAPEDPDMYIHRVGRTARFRKDGQAILLLDPQEEFCVKKWEMKTPIKKKSINPTKTVLVTQKAASLVAADVTLHQLAKKAFVSYVRSLTLLPKQAWTDLKIRDLNLESYAVSLGLATMPPLEFLDKVTTREEKRESKNVNRKLQKLKEQIRLEKEKKQKKRKTTEETSNETPTDEPDDEDILIMKARHEFNQTEHDDDLEAHGGDKGLRKPKRIRIESRRSVKFDEDGQEVAKLLQPQNERNDDAGEGVDKEELEQANIAYIDAVRKRLEQTQQLDKEEERERVRAKHKKRRLQEKTEVNKGDAEASRAVLGSASKADDESVSSTSSDSSSSSSSSSDNDADAEMGVDGHENIALALIRGQT
jgi:ATP-dependent RNA helicase DDX10/DBP4